MAKSAMGLPRVVSRDEWLAARKEFLTKEKAFTRERDVLSAERRKLPMVRVEKQYVFDAPGGKETLAELFGGRSQLIVYNYLDLVPKGRDEDGLAFTMAWLRHHDRYGDGYAVDPTAQYVPPTGSDSLCDHHA
jgi:predicted dithiol-disulfide oxidoreductase (DUF899 family)